MCKQITIQYSPNYNDYMNKILPKQKESLDIAEESLRRPQRKGGM